MSTVIIIPDSGHNFLFISMENKNSFFIFCLFFIKNRKMVEFYFLFIYLFGQNPLLFEEK